MNSLEPIDLNKIEDRTKLTDSLLVDIDQWSEEAYDDGNRTHLGASIIGKSCSRELWYSFRWAKKQTFKSGSKSHGQMLRLFQRGHREEHHMIEYLKGIGCVFEATPEDQLRIADIGDHFGGSIDNVGLLPPTYGILERILFEFKTSNMASFNKLRKNGVVNEKPVHFSQICVYGYKMGLNWCLYLCVDKNTDELYIELVPIDHDHGRQMIDKAGAIIMAKQAPPKISMQATNFACKWCSFSDICHHDEPVEKNCRSCIHSTPMADKKWACDLAPQDNNVIPDNIIPLGCDHHQGIQ